MLQIKILLQGYTTSQTKMMILIPQLQYLKNVTIKQTPQKNILFTNMLCDNKKSTLNKKEGILERVRFKLCTGIQ